MAYFHTAELLIAFQIIVRQILPEIELHAMRQAQPSHQRKIKGF